MSFPKPFVAHQCVTAQWLEIAALFPVADTLTVYPESVHKPPLCVTRRVDLTLCSNYYLLYISNTMLFFPSEKTVVLFMEILGNLSGTVTGRLILEVEHFQSANRGVILLPIIPILYSVFAGPHIYCNRRSAGKLHTSCAGLVLHDSRVPFQGKAAATN